MFHHRVPSHTCVLLAHVTNQSTKGKNCWMSSWPYTWVKYEFNFMYSNFAHFHILLRCSVRMENACARAFNVHKNPFIKFKTKYSFALGWIIFLAHIYLRWPLLVQIVRLRHDPQSMAKPSLSILCNGWYVPPRIYSICPGFSWWNSAIQFVHQINAQNIL